MSSTKIFQNQTQSATPKNNLTSLLQKQNNNMTQSAQCEFTWRRENYDKKKVNLDTDKESSLVHNR